MRVDAVQHEAALWKLRAVRGVAHQPPGRLGDPDLAARARPSQPLGAGDGLPEQRRGGGSPHRPDHVARADARARAQAERQPLAAGAQLGGGAEGTLRVVLVRHRDAEDGQDAVPAKLGHRAAVARAHGASRVVVPVEHAAKRLRVERRDLVRVGEPGEDAGHPAAGVGRDGRVAGRRHLGRGDVPAQDGRLQVAQLPRRLDAEAADQRLAGRAVGLERVRLAAGAVEGEHELAAEPLTERVLPHERLELAGDLGVPPEGEVGVDALAEAAEAEVVEPGDLGLGEALVADVGERRAAPQAERVPQRLRGLVRLAGGELLPSTPEVVLEEVGVERARPQPDGVAATLRHHHTVAHRGAQPRRHHVDGVPRVPRARAAPQLVDDAVERDDGAAPHQQQRQEGERPAARDTSELAPRKLDLDRPEDPDLALHPVRA